MRVNTFLRIARGARGYKVVASSKRPVEPLRTGTDDRALATVVVKLVLELPDDTFTIPTAHATVEPQHLSVVVSPEEVA